MKRALTYTLAVALLLSLTACGTAQAEHPAEPDPAHAVTSTPAPEQTPEPSTTPEPVITPEPASTDAVEPQTLSQTEPAEEPEPAQTMTTAPTPAPESTTKPTTTATDMTAITSTDTVPQQSETVEPVESESAEIQSNNRENWDDEVYAMLTPEQKAVYESLDSSSRVSMNRNIRNTAQAQAEGWTTDWGKSESFGDQWSQISMGQ